MWLSFCSSLRRGLSAESFVSAVEDPIDLMHFHDDDDASPARFVVSSPGLVAKYSQHVTLLECLNWNAPYRLPPESRQFSILHNLKVLLGLDRQDTAEICFSAVRSPRFSVSGYCTK